MHDTDRVNLAGHCLEEIESLAPIIRNLVEPVLPYGLGRAVHGMLLRVERLADLAVLVGVEGNAERLKEIEREILGAPPRSLNAVSSLHHRGDAAT